MRSSILRKSPSKDHRFPREITLFAVRWCLRRARVDWHVDETYIRVGGKWRYLGRAVDTNGQTQSPPSHTTKGDGRDRVHRGTVRPRRRIASI